MALAILMLSIGANELYNFNYAEEIHDRDPINTIENDICTVRFYTSSLSTNKIFIHQNLASVVQKLSEIGDIKAGGYIIKPFHSIWSEEDQKCLGWYKYSFKDKSTYGQMHGNIRVTFRGSIGEPTVSGNKLSLDVSGELFLKVVDKLINIDYSITSHPATNFEKHSDGSVSRADVRLELPDAQQATQ